MTSIRYVRRAHPARHQMYQYVRATSDWLPWAHLVLFLVFVAMLIAAVQCAGGRFDLP